MVVGKKEKGDIKLQRDAKLRLKGKKYEQNVYSDKKTPYTRTVFAPDVKGKIPKTKQIKYSGNTYKAKRSFRTGIKNSKIPVYQFKVTSKATKKSKR